MKDIFEIDVTVSLPLGEVGKIVHITTDRLDWFPYKVRIEKATLNKVGQILEFKAEQMKLEIKDEYE